MAEKTAVTILVVLAHVPACVASGLGQRSDTVATGPALPARPGPVDLPCGVRSREREQLVLLETAVRWTGLADQERPVERVEHLTGPAAARACDAIAMSRSIADKRLLRVVVAALLKRQTSTSTSSDAERRVDRQGDLEGLSSRPVRSTALRPGRGVGRSSGIPWWSSPVRAVAPYQEDRVARLRHCPHAPIGRQRQHLSACHLPRSRGPVVQ